MLEKLFIGLLLSFISGVGFLAVKHPDVYEKIIGKLFIISYAIVISVLSYDQGYRDGSVKIAEAMTKAVNKEAIDYNSLNIDQSKILITIVAIAIFCVYLFVMSIIGQMIKKNNSKNIK